MFLPADGVACGSRDAMGAPELPAGMGTDPLSCHGGRGQIKRGAGLPVASQSRTNLVGAGSCLLPCVRLWGP